MYESLETIRQAAEARLEEIEQALQGYDELIVERDLLREVLSLPPLKGRAGRVTGNGNGRSRARRGQNLEHIVAYVHDRPGATVNDIARDTGIAKGVVYNTVRVLVERGQLESTIQDDGVRAYRTAEALDVGSTSG